MASSRKTSSTYTAGTDLGASSTAIHVHGVQVMDFGGVQMIRRDVLDTSDNIEVEAEEERPKVKCEFSREKVDFCIPSKL